MKNPLFVRIRLWLFVVLGIVLFAALATYVEMEIYLEVTGRPGLCDIHPAPCTSFIQFLIQVP